MFYKVRDLQQNVSFVLGFKLDEPYVVDNEPRPQQPALDAAQVAKLATSLEPHFKEHAQFVSQLSTAAEKMKQISKLFQDLGGISSSVECAKSDNWVGCQLFIKNSLFEFPPKLMIISCRIFENFSFSCSLRVLR